MAVVQLLGTGVKLAFAAELEPCSCHACNQLAARSAGARQLRLRLMTRSEILAEAGTSPAAAENGTPAGSRRRAQSSSRAQPETAHDL